MGDSILAKVFHRLKQYETLKQRPSTVKVLGQTVGDFGLNCTGNLAALGHSDANHFQVCAIGGTSGEHNVGRPINLNIFILNEEMHFFLAYSTQILDEKTATKLLAKLTEVLSKSIGQNLTMSKL